MSTPSPYLVLTRKWGWQCLPNPLRSGYCFDGNYDRDDIYFIYPGDEGTRDTASPLADQGTPMDFTVYVFVDSVTGLLYSADFAAATLTLTLIASIDEDTQNGPFNWIETTNGWRIYVANGVFRTGLFATVYCPSAPGGNQSLPSFSGSPGNVFVQPPGVIIYTPPGSPPVAVNPCDTNVLRFFDNFEDSFCATDTLAHFDNFENQFCDTDTLLTQETFES